MKGRFRNKMCLPVVLVLLSVFLVGCEQVSEAVGGTKGTANMQDRRQKRNSEALSLAWDHQKKQ
ncbi:MAG: hypothetical protein SFU56_00940 [Capsulimonadales bacterium]|nr:hypothetical protein [Capsulimonadales bacterium]